jgi:hypothetical protein
LRIQLLLHQTPPNPLTRNQFRLLRFHRVRFHQDRRRNQVDAIQAEFHPKVGADRGPDQGRARLLLDVTRSELPNRS